MEKEWSIMFLFVQWLVRTEFFEENSYYSNKTAPQTFPTAHKQHRIRTYRQLNEFCAISSSWCLNMKVYCTNTCHDISQYLAMERLHPGKKQFKFSAGLTDVTTRPSKMKVSPKIIKSCSSFLIKVGGEVAGQRKEKKIVHYWLRWRNPFLTFVE